MDVNALYYGDNLEILRRHIPDRSVDLIYLDPPFNSNATYNVLFKEPSGKSSQAQMSAFEDTWHWGLESERALQEIAASEIAPAPVKDFMSVLPRLVGKRTDMMAYLTMMCVRTIELRRVLKDTGSIYLHCDPTASHYLKMLMDTIFGPGNFRNEIVWKRTTAHNTTSRRYGSVTDTVFFYSRSDKYLFNPTRQAHDETYVNDFYRFEENGRKYRLHLVERNQALGIRPNLIYEYKGYTPTYGWMMEKGKLEELDRAGKLAWSSKGRPLRKIYLDEVAQPPIANLWDDIPPIQAQAQERLGYQTQKPEALLERIIKASSNEGDLVLDPFCGCGTAVVAAQKLNRKWIGIDITYLAIGLMEWRLKNMTPQPVYKVIGEPTDLASAINLANKDKYQFQWWAVTKIGGQPYGDRKKGADTGIDGYLYYMDEKDRIKKAIISVKGGKNTNVSMIRDLGHVIEREKADIGVFLTLEKPSRPMLEEAAMKGFYHSPLGRDYPRLQVLTIEGVFEGKRPDIPPWIAPIQSPPRAKRARGKSGRLL